jgi:hypothetical protein
MKKLILMAVLMCGTLLGMAQMDSAHTTKVKKMANPAAWACPKCFMITKEGGQCSMDQTDKVQLGTYYCDHCMKGTGTKAGKCASCANPTVQMTRKLCAKHGVKTEKKKAA